MYPCVFITLGGAIQRISIQRNKAGTGFEMWGEGRKPLVPGLRPSWPPAPNPHILKLINLGNQNLKVEWMQRKWTAAAAAAKSLQSCPTLCDPIDSSPPGSPVPGILQARTLEWVAISFSNAWKWKVKVKSLSRVQLSATPWTAAHQAPPSMGFSRQEY